MAGFLQFPNLWIESHCEPALGRIVPNRSRDYVTTDEALFGLALDLKWLGWPTKPRPPAPMPGNSWDTGPEAYVRPLELETFEPLDPWQAQQITPRWPARPAVRPDYFFGEVTALNLDVPEDTWDMEPPPSPIRLLARRTHTQFDRSLQFNEPTDFDATWGISDQAKPAPLCRDQSTHDDPLREWSIGNEAPFMAWVAHSTTLRRNVVRVGHAVNYCPADDPGPPIFWQDFVIHRPVQPRPAGAYEVGWEAYMSIQITGPFYVVNSQVVAWSGAVAGQ